MKSSIPILLLHGWNLNAAKLDPLKITLEKYGYQVLSLDLPGFRFTTPLKKVFTLDDYGQFVIGYLKKQKVKKTIIIGHSFGGRIGIYLGANYPSLIKELILSGTPALGNDLTPKEKFFLFLAKSGKHIFSYWPLSTLKRVVQKVLYKLVGSYDYYKSSGLLRKTFQNIVSYRLESLLEKISMPSLIIWGEDDKIVPVKVAHGLNRKIKNSQLIIIPDAHHGVPWTHPLDFAREVDKFIKNYE